MGWLKACLGKMAAAGALAAAALVFGAASARADLSKADEAFGKKLYQEALQAYEAALKAGSGEERWKALFRAVECEALQFRYGEALQRMAAAKPPDDPAWKGRFLILKAEVQREFLKQYGFGLRGDVVEGESDATRATPEELRSGVRAAYRELWRLKSVLAGRRAAEEGYFLDLEKADISGTPTLWDFAVERWTGWLLEDEPDDPSLPRPQAAAFLGEEYGGSLRDLPAKGSRIELAAALMEDAARMGGDGGDLARELWRLKRLLLPFRRQGEVLWRDQAAERAAAAARLAAWSSSFKFPASRAEAAFEAAALLEQAQRPSEALKLCERAEADRGSTPGARKCAVLIARLKQPELNLQAEPRPPSGLSVRLFARNLKRVYFRLYPATPAELLGMQRPGWRRGWSQALNSPEPDQLKALLAGGTPRAAWTHELRHPDADSVHRATTTEVAVPRVEPGLYVLMASQDDGFTPGEALVSGVIVNFTDLVLIGTAGFEGREREMLFSPPDPDPSGAPAPPNVRTSEGYHLYAVNGITGRPLNRVGVNVLLWHGGGHEQSFDLSTDDSGRAGVSVAARLVPRESNSYSMDPLAARRSGGRTTYAYWQNPAYLNYSVPAPIQVHLDTDRPIYRPGQKVMLKVTVLLRVPDGFRPYHGRSKAQVRATDANGQELFSAEKALNRMGSAAAEFTIPPGRLLGRYQVSATVSDWGDAYHGFRAFSVEEYKRPEFEVLLKQAEGAWKFGRPAKVEGSARYYFGGPVPNAPVLVKVSREPYVPWFCWWWSWRVQGPGRAEVFRTELKTDEKGGFSFSFTPEPADPRQADLMPARFNVEAEARDAGGRTITASRAYTAGAKALLFSVDMPAGFLTAGGPGEVKVKLMNLDERPVKGKARWALHRLEADPSDEAPGAYWWGGFPASPSLDRIYANVPNGPRAALGGLEFDGKKDSVLRLGGLQPGAYRLLLEADDPWGAKVEQSVIMLAAPAAAGERLGLRIGSLTIAEREEYEVGEKARVLLGSFQLGEAAFVEVWGGQLLLSKSVLAKGGLQILEVPVTRDHKGGFTVRWFGVRDFQVRSGQAFIKVPWKDKQLSARLELRRRLGPGEPARWSLSVRDRSGKPVDGEALAVMFDRSLEYYVKAAASWAKGLYPDRPAAQGGTSSVFQPSTTQLPVEKGWIRKLLDAFHTSIQELLPPGLRMNRTRYGGWFGRGGGRFAALREDEGGMVVAARGEARAKGMPAMAPAPQAMGAAMEADRADERGGPEEKSRRQEGAVEPGAVPRTQFAETAFFLPQIRVRKGRGVMAFKAPEQLTGWRVMAHVLSADVRAGSAEDEAVTVKDLMARVEVPRFFREGDSGTIKAVVHNETDRELTVAVALSVLEDGREAASRLGLKGLEREAPVKPHGLAAFSWPVQVPRGVTTFKVRAVVRSGALKDAEERELPILPSRQRLIETVFAALNGDASKVLALRSFGVKDPSREDELLQLQVDPQLALTVLNSIPFLVRYPHECVEQTLNRYVPLAIVSEVYRKHPRLAAAAAKVPKRSTITPAWEAGDPKRLMSLMETPWLEESRGRATGYPVIDLLNPGVAAREKEDALGKLAQAQLPSGGFPWFPGGREDAYITLVVLAGLAEAQRYGVAPPEDMARRALRYVNNEIPRRLKPEEGDLSLILYAAYVVTSYPKSVPEAAQGYRFAKAWADFADKHGGALTPYGKALIAHVYWRLGERDRGDAWLARVLDGLREDPIAGAYFTPEKMSWLWYTDTVETHAFVLKTLLAMRPKDRRVPGMVQWLIFNRKGNEWKSTKASAAAVFSLLDFMKASGALDKGDEFTVRWGQATERARVEPDDWLARPLRWTRLGAEITPELGRPAVEKRGPGFAFASITHVYSTDRSPEPSAPGMMSVERRFYRRYKEGADYRLKPLSSGEAVRVGDQVEAQVRINTRSQFEYVHLKDPKAAGFEAEELLSGWKWDQLSRYEEPRDSLTNFFIPWLPHGEYILRYRVRPTLPGRYRVGAAVMQSMYAPEFSAHSSGFELAVQE